MADRYKLERHGNWKFVIVDSASKLSNRCLVTYSESIANICLSALNNTKEEKLQADNKQSTPPCNDTECRHNINGICDGTNCMDGMS